MPAELRRIGSEEAVVWWAMLRKPNKMLGLKIRKTELRSLEKDGAGIHRHTLYIPKPQHPDFSI